MLLFLTILTKTFILDVRLGFEYASETLYFILFTEIHLLKPNIF